MSKGYVYILSNPMMPGLVKIGKTTREVNARAVELYQTGVPAPFKVEHQLLTPDCHVLELKVHKALDQFRVDPGREFFNVDVESAFSQVTDLHREIVEEWLSDFLPEHIPIPSNELVCAGEMSILAHELNVSIQDVADAFGRVTSDELKPALQRSRPIRTTLSVVGSK